MKNLMTLALLTALLAIGSSAWAQQTWRVDDQDIKVTSFEPLKYPALGLTARVQGLVVVRVTFDDEGKVVYAAAICGDEVLVPDTLANVRKWRFAPNDQKTAVVVYDFTLDRSCYKRDTFKLEGRNHAIITGHDFIIDGGGPGSHAARLGVIVVAAHEQRRSPALSGSPEPRRD